MYKKLVTCSLLLAGASLFGEETAIREPIQLDTFVEGNEEIAVADSSGLLSLDPSGTLKSKETPKKPKENERHKDLQHQMHQVRMTSELGTVGAMTASGMTPVAEDRGVEIGFDVLYWHPKIDGTEYAVTPGIANNQNGIGIAGSGSSVSNRLKWDWGLRASLGYRFEEENWKLGAIFTYLETSNNSRKEVVAPNSLGQTKASGLFASLVGDSTGFSNAMNASSNVSLNYKTVDLLLSRSYFLSKKLYVAPNFGLKAAWVHVKEGVTYSGGNFLQSYSLGNNSVYVNNSSRFAGLGVAAGTNLRCYVGEGFSFYGNGSLGLVLGNFGLSHQENLSVNPSANTSLTSHVQIPAPNLGLGLGISYETSMKGEKNRIQLSLGYESQVWWDMYRVAIPESFFTRFDSSSINNLYLYGVTFHFEWDF